MTPRRLTEVVPLPPALRGPAGERAPFDWFDERRSQGAVVWDGDRGFWDVVGHGAAASVLSRPEQFSNVILDETDTFHDTLLGMDPPGHTRHRELVEDAFAPSATRSRAGAIRSTARRLLDTALDEPSGRFDAVGSFSRPLPAATIAHVLGVERALHSSLTDAPPPSDPVTPEETAAVVARHDGAIEVAEVLERAIASGDVDRGPVGRLEEGSDLAGGGLLRFAANLFVAGHLTTTHLIGNALRSLAERPGLAARVRSAAREGDTDLIERLVEEALRFHAPLQHTARVATEDVDVAGRAIEEGDRVVIWLLAANRDPEVFEDPDRFDPGRDRSDHLAFGRGPHVCLGASLARAEARIALEELFRRVETLDTVVSSYEPVEPSFVRGVRTLPLRYAGR